MRKLLVAIIAALAFGLSTPGIAHEIKFGALTIVHPWAGATLGLAKTGAVYLTILNDGADTDHLIGVSTPIAETAQIHTTLVENDVVKMRMVNAVEIAPGVPAVFKPGGLHIMLTGLKRPLREWDSFALTLNFENAGSTVVEVLVEEAGTTDAGHGASHEDDPSM